MTSPVSGLNAQSRAGNLALLRTLVATAAIALFVWAGLRTWRATAVTRRDLDRANSTLASYADLRRKYQPAVAAESISWRRTWMQVLELGVVGDERMTMAHAITRAAEAAGLREVRLAIGSADTTGSEQRLSTEGVRRKSAPFGITVQSHGGLRPVIAFLGLLPPSVAATQVEVDRQAGGTNSISLAVYELQFANNPPPMNLAALPTPLRADSATTGFSAQLARDPLESNEISVAKTPGAPTVSRTSGQERRLTAILIADNRPVAVINDKVVEVGTSLPDGARVSRIQADRVWLVEKTGSWRMLTLAHRTQ
jgi:hypothetical protein